MEMPGFEPGAYRMRSERDTTTPHPRTGSLLSHYSHKRLSLIRGHIVLDIIGDIASSLIK